MSTDSLGRSYGSAPCESCGSVALAHFRCNWKRGTAGDVQLRLGA